ncbi:MAG: hypothetical protein Q4D62_14260 [Planctomycetia bacterium]|nr:hypothetical protein [Planctomycetia bacterium]
MKNCFIVLALCLLFFFDIALVFSSEEATSQNPDRTLWFQKHGYGIFIHYLDRLQNNPDCVNSLGKQTSWDDCVAEFDVERFANDVQETGAGYVIFTMMQQSRFLAAPNATFDRITGYAPGQACAKRDLVEEIYEALHKRNIDLLLYWTGDGATRDPQATARLQLQIPVTQQHVENWAAVVREYSLRYGKKVKGWWVDGAYPFIGYDDQKMKILADALQAGNSEAILAFNPGVFPTVQSHYCEEDYTAGEMTSFGDIPQQRFLNGKQWHLATFLGDAPYPDQYWGAPGVRMEWRELAEYLYEVQRHGGVVTMDVLTYRDGSLERSQVLTLKKMRPALEELTRNRHAWKEGKAIPPRNAAWRQKAELKSLDGSRTLIPSGGLAFRAYSGNDGDWETLAIGANEWPWRYEITLEEPPCARKIVVYFGKYRYPTDCEILFLPVDSDQWQSAGRFQDQKGEPLTVEIPPTTLRKVAVLSYKPDGPNQPGHQMGVAEMQVFE